MLCLAVHDAILNWIIWFWSRKTIFIMIFDIINSRALSLGLSSSITSIQVWWSFGNNIHQKFHVLFMRLNFFFQFYYQIYLILSILIKLGCNSENTSDMQVSWSERLLFFGYLLATTFKFQRGKQWLDLKFTRQKTWYLYFHLLTWFRNFQDWGSFKRQIRWGDWSQDQQTR